MSAENPTGAKLEELLEQIAVELEAKNAKIEHDPQPCSRAISTNNLSIISALRKCVHIQNDSLDQLDELGEDLGPNSPPRIGN
jgi:hypothetical protein